MPCVRFTSVIERQPTQTAPLCREVDDALCLTRRVTGSVTATLSRTPAGTETISGTSGGSSTAQGALSALANIVGTSAGSSTASGTLVDSNTVAPIQATASGGSAAFGTLSGTGALAASAGGASTATGTLAGTGALAATAAGSSTATGTLEEFGTAAPISGTAGSSSAAAGTLTATGALAGAAAGNGTATGTILGAGALAGSAAGSATATGALSGGGTGLVPDTLPEFWDSFTTDIDPATDDAAVTSWNADSGIAARNLDTAIADTVRANGGLDSNDTVSLETTSAQLRSDIDQITSLINSNTWEVFIVANITSASGGTGATNYWLNSFLFGDDQRTWSIAVDSSGVCKTGFFVGGDQAVEDSGIDIRGAGPVIVRAARNGADLEIQVASRTTVTVDTGQTGSTTGSRIAVGDTGSGGFVGRLHIFAFDDYLSTSDRAGIYAYLSSTYSSVATP